MASNEMAPASNTGTDLPATSPGPHVVGDLDKTGQAIERLYYEILGRAADTPSLALDSAALDSGRLTLPRLANSLLNSNEFLTDFGETHTRALVKQLFEAATGGPIDPGTLRHDYHAVLNGESAGVLAVHYAQSEAAIIHLASKPI